MTDLQSCTRCGTPTIRAERHEADRVVEVRWCLDGCGREFPPFVQQRATRVIRVVRTCAWCGDQFAVTPIGGTPLTCSLSCADRRAALRDRRVRNGRAMRKAVS